MEKRVRGVNFGSNVWHCSSTSLSFCDGKSSKIPLFTVSEVKASKNLLPCYCELDIIARNVGQATKHLETINEDCWKCDYSDKSKSMLYFSYGLKAERYSEDTSSSSSSSSDSCETVTTELRSECTETSPVSKRNKGNQCSGLSFPTSRKSYLDLMTAKAMYYAHLPNKSTKKRISFPKGTEQIAVRKLETINLPMLASTNSRKCTSRKKYTGINVDILGYTGKKAFYRRIHNSLVLCDTVVDDNLKKRKVKHHKKHSRERQEIEEGFKPLKYYVEKVKANCCLNLSEGDLLTVCKEKRKQWLHDEDAVDGRSEKHRHKVEMETHFQERVAHDEADKSIVHKMFDVLNKKWNDIE